MTIHKEFQRILRQMSLSGDKVDGRRILLPWLSYMNRNVSGKNRGDGCSNCLDSLSAAGHECILCRYWFCEKCVQPNYVPSEFDENTSDPFLSFLCYSCTHSALLRACLQGRTFDKPISGLPPSTTLLLPSPPLSNTNILPDPRNILHLHPPSVPPPPPLSETPLQCHICRDVLFCCHLTACFTCNQYTCPSCISFSGLVGRKMDKEVCDQCRYLIHGVHHQVHMYEEEEEEEDTRVREEQEDITMRISRLTLSFRQDNQVSQSAATASQLNTLYESSEWEQPLLNLYLLRDEDDQPPPTDPFLSIPVSTYDSLQAIDEYVGSCMPDTDYTYFTAQHIEIDYKLFPIIQCMQLPEHALYIRKHPAPSPEQTADESVR